MKHETVTCVFVHGWAMNSAVWNECIAKLPQWINVVVVDLPGHGSMSDVAVGSLDDLVQTLTTLAHRPVMWVGWSLGGLAVLRLAELYPERVAAALLVACNPCFVRKENWPCGVEAEVFNQFSSNLNKNQEKTLQRFLLLQVKNLPEAKQAVKQLQLSLKLRGQASTQALNLGLQILLETDLRQALRSIGHRLHWLFGAQDALVPAAAATVLQGEYGQKNVVVNAKASHAPFISHQEDFIKQLIEIAEQLRTR